MFCTHIYFNGNCREAIEAYQKALQAELLTIIPNPAKANQIAHAEMRIHGQMLMLNDFGGQEGSIEPGGYQLVVQFEHIAELEEAYAALQADSLTISARQPTDYSPCVVRFIDRFGTRWAFWALAA